MADTKLVTCEKCRGTGYVNGGDENSAWSKICEDCHGIGFSVVPKTNADRLRAMSDEELAKILNAFTEYFSECNRSADEVDCKDCELNNLCQLHEGKAIEWLQQPAEGE